MADTRIYLGRPGALAAIRSPRGTFEATRQRRIATFELGVGGVAVDQMLGGARIYTINYEQLNRDDWSVLQAFLDGHEGPGPFALLDPGQRNMLPPNIAGATSVANSVTAAGAPVGGFLIRAVDDDFNRAPVASGFGTAPSGQAWTAPTGGTTSQFNVTGGVATIASTTTNVVRAAVIPSGHTDFDVTTDLSIDVGTPTGAAISQFIYGRYTDIDNFYQVNLQVTTAGAVTLQFGKKVATVGAAIGSAITVGTAHASGDIWRVHFQGIQSGGTCNLKASAWPIATATEPTTWQATTTDAALTTGASIGVAARLETGNTNPTPVTLTCYGITAESMATSESSSTAFTDAGPRSLAVNFSAAPTGGAVSIGMDWPSSTFSYGVPVVASRAVCFSAFVRGGGTDAITTWTPRILWKDATGAIISTTSAGSGAITSSAGAWAQLYATGTPPATTVYADLRVDYTSGASAGAIAYFRRFMFNEGTTPDTTWAPGTGVWPVRMITGTETWPFLSPELRAGPVVSFVEDVS